VSNYFEEGDFPLEISDEGLRKGRSVRDGYARGWGLEFGELGKSLRVDPTYQEAMALAEGRTIQTEECRLNLFLIAKYFLPKLAQTAQGGAIVEFGSYRGGSAIFLAAVCRSLGLNVKVYGLDTFGGMPPVDKAVDAHNEGDFAGVDLAELRAYVSSCGLDDFLEFVPGFFEDTAPGLLGRAAPTLLAHIDCDVYTSVAYAWEAIKPHMAAGGYVAFDDAHMSSCLGATEAVEDLVIRRDGLNCEQIWPHFVFRVWPESVPAPAAQPDQSKDSLTASALQTLLQRSRQEAANWRNQYEHAMSELSRVQSELLTREARSQVPIDQLDVCQRRYARLRAQVTMAKRSKWLRAGRIAGLGPKFDLSD
jgi:hypothetical protein